MADLELLADEFRKEGYSDQNAEARVCQDIVLKAIAESDLSRNVTIFTDQRYSMMNMEKMNVAAADGSKAIAMFKLPGGEVVAHGSQQPDRRRTGSDVSVKPERKDTGPKVGKEVKRPEKIKVK